jgi:hypothetical protein
MYPERQEKVYWKMSLEAGIVDGDVYLVRRSKCTTHAGVWLT